MNRIDVAFAEKKLVAIGYLTAGYPDPDQTLEWVKKSVESGFDIVELGLPFSDPVADGPTIEKASISALAKGLTPLKYLEIAGDIRRKFPDLPLITMTYYNLIARGGEKFLKELKKGGIDGLILPDLPLIEGEKIYSELQKMGFATPLLIPPTLHSAYRKKIEEKETGLIYVVSRSGTTGERKDIPEEGIRLLDTVKKETSKPVAIGFGISSPEQVKPIKGKADGIIIGSALIKKLSNNEEISEWIREIKKEGSQ